MYIQINLERTIEVSKVYYNLRQITEIIKLEKRKRMVRPNIILKRKSVEKNTPNCPTKLRLK